MDAVEMQNCPRSQPCADETFPCHSTYPHLGMLLNQAGFSQLQGLTHKQAELAPAVGQTRAPPHVWPRMGTARRGAQLLQTMGRWVLLCAECGSRAAPVCPWPQPLGSCSLPWSMALLTEPHFSSPPFVNLNFALQHCWRPPGPPLGSPRLQAHFPVL